MQPEKIILRESELIIQWDKDEQSVIPFGNLRRWCPCAACESERVKEPEHFIPLLSGAQLKVKSVSPVGRYALQVFWADGHNTGIYEYSQLKRIASLGGKKIALS